MTGDKPSLRFLLPGYKILIQFSFWFCWLQWTYLTRFTPMPRVAILYKCARRLQIELRNGPAMIGSEAVKK